MRLARVSVIIRASRRSDGPALRDIERAAGERFCGVDLAHVADDEPLSIQALDAYAAAGRSWVAVDDRDQPAVTSWRTSPTATPTSSS